MLCSVMSPLFAVDFHSPQEQHFFIHLHCRQLLRICIMMRHIRQDTWVVTFLYFIGASIAPMLAFSSNRKNHGRIIRNSHPLQSLKYNLASTKYSSKPRRRTQLLLNNAENTITSTENNINNRPTQSNIQHHDKEIVVTSTIELPFSAHTAFDAFSDLPRQPTWSHWLKSVQYIHHDEDEKLPTTLWTLGWRGFTFNWVAKSTRLVRPHIIEWESISGLKNRGIVSFIDLSSGDSKPIGRTEMRLTLIFIAPRIVSLMFNNSGRIKAAIESSVIQKTLVNFRDVVVRHDLKGM